MTAPHEHHSLLNGKRILVVEDDDRLYCALKDSLLDVGCEIFGSCDRMSGALDTMPREHVDAALIDSDNLSVHRVAMLTRQLRGQGVPVLLITRQALAQLPTLLRTNHSLQKPFTAEQLLDRMAQTLRVN